MTTPPAWHQQVGSQRDWVWRGWQTRYTFVRSLNSNSTTPLMLLHGFGASIGHWRHNLPELGRHHTVYALDLLGFGASEKAAATYGIAFWVEQVYDFWRSFIRRPMILVGNSIGSLICMAAAAAHPEMVCGVVMLNLPDSSVLEVPRWVTEVVRVLNPIAKPVLGVAKWIITTPPLFNPVFWLIRQPRMLRLWARQAYATPIAITDELVEIFSSPTNERGAARTLRAMINAKSRSKVNYSAKAVLPQLKIPLLLFWGLKDAMVPPKLASLFLQYNPNLKLIEIEDAGHCPHDECPERINQEILTWIAGCVEFSG